MIDLSKKKKFSIDETVKKYVEFVNSLSCENCNKIIFAIYPTTIKDKNLFGTLLNY